MAALIAKIDLDQATLDYQVTNLTSFYINTCTQRNSQNQIFSLAIS